MAAIITGSHGMLAYYNARPQAGANRAFGLKGEFHRPLEQAFAGLPAFAANRNHSPDEAENVICWDAGVDLLFRIAEAR